MKKKLSCLLILISIQILAFWSCAPSISNEVVTGVTLRPYTVAYQDSLQSYELQDEILPNDTNSYVYKEIGWAFSEQYTIVYTPTPPSFLAPFASSAYAFQKSHLYNRLQKLVSRKVYTLNDYNTNYPAQSEITSICITGFGLPFGDLSKRIEDSDYPLNHLQKDFFILQEGPSSPREVVLRIVYEFENDEKLHATTSAIIKN